MTSRTCLLGLSIAIAACAPTQDDVDDPPRPLPAIDAGDELGEAPLRSPCPGSDQAFAARAIRLIQGRRPAGVRETRLLAAIVADLDARGLPGRTLVARGLASGPRYRARWRGTLLDLLRAPRLGASADLACYGHPGPLAEAPELAAFVRDHPPGDPTPAALRPWTMADLIGSSLALDDLSPLLRAHLIVRGARPLGGNNVAPDDLERARRVFLGRGFEAAYLGRRLECLGCHHGGGDTVLDAADPASDRTWPVIPGLEDLVFGAPWEAGESSAFAAFRFEGFAGGAWRPWGADDACPGFVAEPGDDPLGDAGHLGGPLPPGASARDLEAILARGLDGLRGRGLDLGVGDERAPRALAAMAAIHLADRVWREASGQPLTMPHGQPRGRTQRAILEALARRFASSGYSLRELLVAVATHPLLDLAPPGACAAPLPPIFDPFAASNHAGDLIRREEPWLLLDGAAIAMGWPRVDRLPLPYGWKDEELLRSLGVFLDESEPGHRGLDVVAALAWEASVGAGVDPGWLGPPTRAGDEDVLAELTRLARETPGARVEDALAAVSDRVIQESELGGPAERAALAALVGAPLEAPLIELDGAGLEAGLRRYAGLLLASPQFTLAGLPPPDDAAPPGIVVADASTRALCDALAPAIVGPIAALEWRCDDEGIVIAGPEES